MYKQNLSENEELRLPLNIQFFAESAGEGEGKPASESGSEEGEKGDESPSVEELMAQLATEKAERLKAKNALDVALKENKEVKTQLRAKMTAEEQLDAAKKEEFDALRNENEEIKKRMEIIDNTSFWSGKTIGMDETLAKSTAEAEATGDKEKFRENIAKHITAISKAAEEKGRNDFLASRPDIKAGNGYGDKNAMAIEMAKESANRRSGVNTDILNQY